MIFIEELVISNILNVLPRHTMTATIWHCTQRTGSSQCRRKVVVGWMTVAKRALCWECQTINYLISKVHISTKTVVIRVTIVFYTSPIGVGINSIIWILVVYPCFRIAHFHGGRIIQESHHVNVTIVKMRVIHIKFSRHSKTICKFVIKVDTHLWPLIFSGNSHSRLVEKVGRYIIAIFLTTTRNTDLVVLTHSGLQHFFLPINTFLSCTVCLHIFIRYRSTTSIIVQCLCIFVRWK